MPYFRNINTLYIHVPKTGGMSIEEYFFSKSSLDKNEKSIYGWYFDKPNRIRVPQERSLQHFTYQEILKEKHYFDFEENNNMIIIASVRNPFDRIVSDLFWSNKISPTSTKQEVAEAIDIYFHKNLAHPYDNHKLPQFKFFTDKFGNVLPNVKIVRTEYLKEDMHKLGYTDFDIHTNKNKTGLQIDYRSLLNEESVNAIIKFYKQDFTIFNYSTDLYPTPNNLRDTNDDTSYTSTIVTAFISNINVNKVRSLDTYIEYGKKLLSIPNPKVVFMDSYSYNTYFKDIESSFPLTKFIKYDKEEIYLYNYKDQLTKFNINTGNKEKDTLDYIFVQCNKTEWVQKAIDMNIWKTNQYIWVDFGIYHMIRDDEKFAAGIHQMVKKSYDTLRIASCKWKDYSISYNVYETITWTFAGSVFGGDIDSLLKFAYLTKAEILRTIKERNHIMWEINIWYIVNKKHHELMDFYNCAHDIRILYNY